MHRSVLPILCTGLAAFLVLPSAACKYSVRDTGFVDLGQPPWSLRLEGFTPQQREPWERTAPGRLAETNLRLEPARPATSATDPALLLVAADGRTLPLARHPDLPAGSPAIAGFLEHLVLSQTRDRLHELLLPHFAVLLLVEGTDPAATAEARKAADAAIQAFTPLLPTLPKPHDRPAVLAALDPSQVPGERVLLWSLGLDPNPTAAPRLAVLFGRGRLLGPPLEGPLITRTSVQQRLALVGQDCECDLDRSWFQGPVFPARWDTPRQHAAARLLGFDPENPLVRSEVSRIVFRDSQAATPRRPAPSATDPLALGYHEEAADAPETEETGEAAQDPPPSAALGTHADLMPDSPGHGLWLATGAAAAVVLVTGVVLFIKTLRAR